jgi:hypothetical protein
MDVTLPNNLGTISGTHPRRSSASGAMRCFGRAETTCFTYWMSANNGPLDLLVSANGYLPQYQKVQLRPRQETVVDIACGRSARRWLRAFHKCELQMPRENTRREAGSADGGAASCWGSRTPV